jgi:hypothetical protein
MNQVARIPQISPQGMGDIESRLALEATCSSQRFLMLNLAAHGAN